MKSIVSKLLIMVLSVILVTNTVFLLVSKKMSTVELSAAIKSDMNRTAALVASEVRTINEQEFKMLAAFGSLSEIKDPAVDMHEKWRMITAVSRADTNYLGMAIYDDKGVGWTTTEKYQDLSSREYLAESLKTRKPYIMKPNWSPVNGNVSTFYAYPYFDDEKQMAGVLVAVVNGIHLSEIVSEMTFGKSSRPCVIEMKSGAYVASADISDISEQRDIREGASPEFLAIIDRMCAGETGEGSYTDPETKIRYTCCYMPVGGNCDWAVLLAAPMEDFFGGLNTMVLVLEIVFVLSTVFAALLTGLMIVHAVRPLKKVQDNISEIATGNADLTKRIDFVSKDEIGGVVKGFNQFTERLQTIVRDIKNSEDKLSAAGQNLQSGTEDTKNVLNEILASIHNVNGQVLNQNENVTQTAGAVNQIAANIESLESMIETQAAGITQSSAAVEEMIGNISSVDKSVEKMFDSFDSLRQNANDGISRQEYTNAKINTIVEESKSLQEANAVIANIAEQTNLLAMNAAIEAAHAGEAGKGFSVVADEIRKLSETSSAQSRTIGDQLTKISAEITEMVDAAKGTAETLNLISSGINSTGTLVTQIRNAMQEQGEGSKQIVSALSDMNSSTGNVRSAAKEMADSNKLILDKVRALESSSATIKDSITEMTESTKKIQSTGATLEDVSKSIKASIDNIGSEIDQFRV